MSVPVGLRKRLAPTGQPPMPLTDQARSLYSSRAGILPEAVQIGFCFNQIDHPRQICRLENQRPHSTISDFRFCLDRFSEGPKKTCRFGITIHIPQFPISDFAWTDLVKTRKDLPFRNHDP